MPEIQKKFNFEVVMIFFRKNGIIHKFSSLGIDLETQVSSFGFFDEVSVSTTSLVATRLRLNVCVGVHHKQVNINSSSTMSATMTS